MLAVGELGKAEEGDLEYSILRLHEKVDLEVFYFNNTLNGQGKCDRKGPVLDDGPHHEVHGSTIHWSVAASDGAGVWRVVVVYTDETLDDEGRGRWIPLELEDDGTGVWRGSLLIPGPSRVTYYLQAVDRRGNVSWLEYDAPEDPASGVELGIPRPVDVAVVLGAADLAVDLVDAPDPVAAGDPLVYTVQLRNLGPDPASEIEVACSLPNEVMYVFAGAEGWICQVSGHQVLCTRDGLDVGMASDLSILVTAPSREGTLRASVTVNAIEEDHVGSNSEDSESTRVKR